ncbi:PREDICTED: four-domain proteases inhibitor-like [Wasmannia auropunctata]|uniref:four-domain proteases inhibitor-like n=1 Tax=Wasmannia auropunctata TaxID=64793 RepID=UPI0005F05D13|nr:PREDICTED: four-domain proteases inhibitor-like [Wasmannia auropunctata]
MSFHLLLLIAASPLLITAFPQNSDDVAVAQAEMVQVDGFVFDGPVATEQSNGEQRITSTSTTTTTTASTITSTSTTTTTTQTDDQYNRCVTNCPVTNEYNPVCGTDNTDYTNPGGLGCAQRCGKDVRLNHYGRCSTGRIG